MNPAYRRSFRSRANPTVTDHHRGDRAGRRELCPVGGKSRRSSISTENPVSDMLVRGSVAMYAVLGDGGEARGEDSSVICALRVLVRRKIVSAARKVGVRGRHPSSLSASREDLAALAPVMAGIDAADHLKPNKASDTRAALVPGETVRASRSSSRAALRRHGNVAKGSRGCACDLVMAGAMNNIPNSFSSPLRPPAGKSCDRAQERRRERRSSSAGRRRGSAKTTLPTPEISATRRATRSRTA